MPGDEVDDEMHGGGLMRVNRFIDETSRISPASVRERRGRLGCILPSPERNNLCKNLQDLSIQCHVL